jgi:FdhD protein
MAIENYQGRKFINGEAIHVDDNLTVEQALQININNKPFSITMRTPGNDKELIRGLLYSEDIYRNTENLVIELNENKEKSITEASLTIREELLKSGYSNSRSFLSASSCGICGKTELDELDTTCKIDEKNQIDLATLLGMFEKMKAAQPTFKKSGGSHAAAAFTNNGQLLSIREDIGRHNAVDKVIGHLANENSLTKAKCLTVSGRISYEIIAKAFAAKIPVLAAVSAPSTLAVDFAKELGITLLAFCRENKATCYSNPYRILSQ